MHAHAGEHDAASLDLTLHHYNRVLTAEGITRISQYQEIMLRRPDHVWVERVLPKIVPTQHEAGPVPHKEFNPETMPRLITLKNHQVQIEFADREEKCRVAIDPAEYENVSFDGSWENSYYLVSPSYIASLPVSNRKSPSANALWHETTRDGKFQRILWDKQNQIPLEIEYGNIDGTVYNRVQVRISKGLASTLPWKKLLGYSLREYADYLD